MDHVQRTGLEHAASEVEVVSGPIFHRELQIAICSVDLLRCVPLVVCTRRVGGVVSMGEAATSRGLRSCSPPVAPYQISTAVQNGSSPGQKVRPGVLNSSEKTQWCLMPSALVQDRSAGAVSLSTSKYLLETSGTCPVPFVPPMLKPDVLSGRFV